MNEQFRVLTIDGPAGAGKSTVARGVANRLGAAYLDSGAIYRCLALAALRESISWEDEVGLEGMARALPISFCHAQRGQKTMLGEEDVTTAIRSPHISQGASAVSAHPRVRQQLLDLQRQLSRSTDVVAEGRDMGTTVFPDADVKIFLVADETVRARRRLQDLHQAGHDADLEAVLEAQRERDKADKNRATSPLQPASDAIMVDTSGLGITEVVDRVLELCHQQGWLEGQR